MDAFRYLGFVAVVVLHAVIYGAKRDSFILSVTEHLCRFAVPFFFIASGYFLHKSDTKFWAHIGILLRRILPVYAFWLLIYLVVSDVSFADLRNPGFVARCIFLGGPAIHLWFLPSLGVAASAVIVLRRFGPTALIAISAGLYAVGLGLGPYREAIGLPHVPFDTRNGPFFATLLVAIGFVQRQNRHLISQKQAFCLMLLGLSAQLGEAYILHVYYEAPFSNYDFLVGTIFFAFAVFMLSLNQQQGIFVKLTATLGQKTLGMYCVHLLFLWWLSPLFDPFDLFQCLVLAAIVVVLSTLSALALAKLPLLRRLAA